jgi:O-antigen/teichoic acid export membrane protein
LLLLLLLAMLLGASLFDSGSDGSIIKKLLLLSIPMMLIEMLSFNLISIHRGYERFDRALLASLFEKVVKYGVLIYVVIATSNMFYIFMYGLLSAAFLFVAHSVLIKCWYREIFFFKYCSYDMLSSIKAISVWAWVLGMVGLISLQLDKWFVGYYFGYEILAVYGLAIMIFGQLHTFNSASIAWILPEVSKNGFTKENVRRYSTLPIYLLMSSCLAVFLVHKFEFLFISWLGAEQYSSAEKYIDVATALLPVYAATLVPQYYLVATGMFKKHTQIDSVILITKGILLITVVRLFDVYHVAYILCTLALISSFMYQFELYKVGLKSKNIIIQLVTPLMGFIVTLSILNSLI